MAGEGCDYTIGCGMRFDFIEAGSIEEAQELAIWPDGREEWSSLEGEFELSDILIIPAEYITVVDVNKIKKEINAEKASKELIENEQKEREQLAMLQAKYAE